MKAVVETYAHMVAKVLTYVGAARHANADGSAGVAAVSGVAGLDDEEDVGDQGYDEEDEEDEYFIASTKREDVLRTAFQSKVAQSNNFF